MKKTGELLKNQREVAKLSISEVALATKINPKILTAIENGDESKLPAKTFLKGFVRSYALFLKMDVDGVLRCFQDEMGGPPPVERAAEPQRQEASTNGRRRVDEESSAGMRTAAVVVIVLLIALIIGVRELIEKYQREKRVASPDTIKVSPLLQPPVETTSGVPAPPPPPAVEPTAASEPAKSEPAKTEAVTSQPPAVPAPPPPPEVKPAPAKAAEAPKPEPKVEAKPEPKAEAKSEAKSEAKPEPKTEAKAADKSSDKNIRNEIILEALDKVDVMMKVKGETKKISLNATQVHTIHADQPVVFDFSDGGAVNIILNGKERGVPGDLGKPKQITIP